MNAKQLKEWEAEEAERRFIADCCFDELERVIRRQSKNVVALRKSRLENSHGV